MWVGALAVLEVYNAFKIDLWDVVVVEEAIGSGRDCDEGRRRCKKEEGRQVQLNRRSRGENADRGKRQALELSVRHRVDILI